MQLPERIGPFRIVRELGSGGMGVVVLARQVDTKRTVALKILSPDLARMPEARERFHREVRAASALDHPAIVQVLESGEADGLLYFAMRHVEGRPLSELLVEGQGARLPPDSPPERERVPWIVETVETCARALHHAHMKRVIHRDVKPSNVLIDQRGSPYLVDFGLAYVEGRHSITESGRALGTIPYMAPEIVSGQRIKIDGRTDVYSLGVLLYECLCGRRPFEGDTREAIFQSILFKEPLSPRVHLKDLSRDLETISLKCLEKDPDRRYATALALAEDLERLRTFRPILARPVGLFGRLRRFAKRNPALALVSAASSIVVLALLVLLAMQVISRQLAYERLERALASIQLLADAFEARVLLEVEERPFAKRSAELPAMAHWRARCADLRSREELYRNAREGSGEHAAALQETGRLLETLEALPRLGRADELVAANERLVSARFDEIRAAHESEWDTVRRELAEDERFAGLATGPIEGLVPLGRNEVGLQEFWHVESGERPKGMPGGGWKIGNESGIVLVLLPPGELAMGPREGEPPIPNLPPGERPCAVRRVPAFLLGRYEVTQRQWLRAWGSNPSSRPEGRVEGNFRVSGVHPVEMVTWEQVQECARRLALRTPSELEWEYAARAGGICYYVDSDDPDSLQWMENIADGSFANPELGAADWNDGYPVHAPVGSLAPNAFGLHDLLGNVSEWTCDVFAVDYAEVLDGKAEGIERSFRGGNWYVPVKYCRTTSRQHTWKGNALPALGWRAARSYP